MGLHDSGIGHTHAGWQERGVGLRTDRRLLQQAVGPGYWRLGDTNPFDMMTEPVRRRLARRTAGRAWRTSVQFVDLLLPFVFDALQKSARTGA